MDFSAKIGPVNTSAESAEVFRVKILDPAVPLAELNPVFVVLQVDCMEEALQRSQGGDLKVSVLLDYSRGSRGSSLPPAALLVAWVAPWHSLVPSDPPP